MGRNILNVLNILLVVLLFPFILVGAIVRQFTAKGVCPYCGSEDVRSKKVGKGHIFKCYNCKKIML